MAARISTDGRVTVSLRRSIGFIDRGRKPFGDGAGKRVAAARDEHDVNACGDRLVNGLPVGLRHLSEAIEQRAVDVDANESNQDEQY